MTQIPRQTKLHSYLSSDREELDFSNRDKLTNTLGAYARFGGATSRKLRRFTIERAFEPPLRKFQRRRIILFVIYDQISGYYLAIIDPLANFSSKATKSSDHCHLIN